MLTDDPNTVGLGHGIDNLPVPVNPVYLVLSSEELAKGFVRPVYRAYIHSEALGGCGAVTTMGLRLCETYARDPSFYGSTYCSGCSMHRPVGDSGEFYWDKTNLLVGT
jgi:hypothetical protein